MSPRPLIWLCLLVALVVLSAVGCRAPANTIAPATTVAGAADPAAASSVLPAPGSSMAAPATVTTATTATTPATATTRPARSTTTVPAASATTQGGATRPTAKGGRTIAFSALPKEAQETMALIDRGGPFPYDRDGVVFQNREGYLPSQPRGWYREYTVKTPGSRDRGARRIVAGQDDRRWYTADHYETFQEIHR